MEQDDLATALQRAKRVLQRRPDKGLHDDAPAIARLGTGTRVVSRHANGTAVTTDMPRELGGGGEQVTPGWLFRAGLASCAATSIAMNAATDGIMLEWLEVEASSRSDTRGVLRVAGQDGMPVSAGSQDLQLRVRLRAPGVAAQALRTLVEEGLRGSPIPVTVTGGAPLAVHVHIDAD